MNSAGDAFGFPFRSPNWLGTVVLQGLIFIIPIIGQISMLGWLLITLDNLRAGREELAPAGFHLGRGISLFGVQVIYGLGLLIIPIIFQVIGRVMIAQGSAAGGGVLALGGLLELVASLILAFLLPALILRTSAFGFSGGMDVAAVWQQATANVGQTVVTALLIYVAELIGGLGIICCFVGVLFTMAYAYGVIAGLVAWYERQQGVPSPAV